MDEVKIHTGTRVKLKSGADDALPETFAELLRQSSHADERVQAVYLFSLQVEDGGDQTSLAIAIRTGLFGKDDEAFLDVVDHLQTIMPDDLSLNLYRFGASDFLAAYCVEHLEPLYLRSTAWLDKQRRKYLK